jgi:tight adherence protein B
MGAVLFSFVLTLALVLGAYWTFVVRPEQQAQTVFWRRLRSKVPAAKARTDLMKKVQQLSAVPTLDSMLNRSRAGVRPVERLIEQSGSKITVGAFLLASCVCGLVAVYLAYQVTGLLLLSLPVGALAGIVPTSVLRIKRTRRVLRFEEQLPEALALISRALKAGHTLTTGLAMVADEMPTPIGPEFRLLYDQQNYGMPLPDALKEFARRVPLLDARFFVTAVLIQRESGGNLSEILDNIASVIRDRFRVKRQIRVVSAHARMTGFVLCAVPPALAFVLFLINPEHLRTLTGSALGVRLIIAAVVMQVMGTLVIRQMIRIEY